MFSRILVPVDTSPTADRALDMAIRLAADQAACLRVVHVIETPAASLIDVSGVDLVGAERDGAGAVQPVLDAAADLARQAGVDTERGVLPAEGEKASDVILAEAIRWSADLLVIGSGRTGVRRLVFGSVADDVVHRAEIPVMVV